MNSQIVIKKMKVVSIGFINYCYLIINENTRDALIVDPAWEFEFIINELRNYRLNLKGILVTHSHYDHINLIPDLMEKYELKVYLSEVEAKYYSVYLENMILLNNMEQTNCESIKFTPILTPGHTKGGMSYLIDEHLFTGDTIFIEGCGICDTLGGSANELFKSVQLIKKLPLNTMIWPGHSFGLPTGQPLSVLMKENIYFQINDIDKFVAFANRKSRKNIFGFK